MCSVNPRPFLSSWQSFFLHWIDHVLVPGISSDDREPAILEILIAFLLILILLPAASPISPAPPAIIIAGKNNRSRVVFILIHVHIFTACLAAGIWMAWRYRSWGYTIAGALVVNALTGNTHQKFTVGLLLCPWHCHHRYRLQMPADFLMVSLLFLVKVLYAFAVDHYPFRGDPGKQSNGGK